MRADLHIHTTASDGIFSPREIVVQAAEEGLKIISITDHDTINGLKDINKSILDLPVMVIPGIEFSADLPNHEVHILGYYIDINNEQLTKQLGVLKENRRQRSRLIVDKLISMGYDITYDQIVEYVGKSTIGRAHIARFLVSCNFFDTVSDVFNNLLSIGRPAYVPHARLSPQQVIQTIKDAGGLAVLAHPGLVGSLKIIRDIIGLGIDGIEVYHPKHTEQDVEFYTSLAKQYKLLLTGGSDFHGIASRFPEKLGVYSIVGDFALELKKKWLMSKDKG